VKNNEDIEELTFKRELWIVVKEDKSSTKNLIKAK